MNTATKPISRIILSALCMVALMPVCSFAQETGYPQAEWTRARAILMHTPGDELFDGVIHPAAGLFEHYFDVDSAACEHRHYMDMLKANGITVHTVNDILQEIGIDTLRNLASQVLTYNVSALSRKDAAAYGDEYKQETVNQMSRKDLIRVLLLQPTVQMQSVDNNTGIEATYIHQSLMNLYFTRDQSITTPVGHVICNMNSSQRAPETRIIEACYEHLGREPILEITGKGHLEGGDYIPAGDVAFIGLGMRTNQEGIRQIMDADAFGHDTIIVVEDHKLWQMEMHLDTHFNIIDKDLCTMPASRINAKRGDPEFCTADIWARQPGTKKYKLVAKNKDFVQLIKDLGYTIIPVNIEDEYHYANNYLTISPRHIMAVAGQSEEYQNLLRTNGVTVEWIPLESLIDGYGAAHCMTQVLEREITGPAVEASIPDSTGFNPDSEWL